MDTVTLSSKYQVVIPRSIRTRARLAPGMRLQVILHDGRIEFVPVRPMRAMRGFLKGYDLSFTRDEAVVWTMDDHFKNIPHVRLPA